MGCKNFARALIYLLLWIFAVSSATLIVAVAVPSLAVLWFTSGQHHPLIDEYVVCMINLYDSIVAVTLLLMLTCMTADSTSWLITGRPLSGRVLLRIFFTSGRNVATASECGYCLYCGVVSSHHEHAAEPEEASAQSELDHLPPRQPDDSHAGDSVLTRPQLEDAGVAQDMDTELKVRGLEVSRLWESASSNSTSHESGETLSDAFDRSKAEAEQTAIANEIHRLLQNNVPDIDPYFIPNDREEFKRWVVDIDDVEVLEDLVTGWLRKRDDLQTEKDRYLLLFHMRGLDSTCQLYQSDPSTHQLELAVDAGSYRDQEDRREPEWFSS